MNGGIRIFLMSKNFCTYTDNMSFHTTRKADFTHWTRLGDVLIAYATCQTLAYQIRRHSAIADREKKEDVGFVYEMWM